MMKYTIEISFNNIPFQNIFFFKFGQTAVAMNYSAFGYIEQFCFYVSPTNEHTNWKQWVSLNSQFSVFE